VLSTTPPQCRRHDRSSNPGFQPGAGQDWAERGEE